MEYTAHSHRHALTLLNSEEPFASLWTEITDAIASISDSRLASQFEGGPRSKSLSAAINQLLKNELIGRGWAAESPIFADPVYDVRGESRWRLDFAKDAVSVEVAFNHGEAAAWNLLKPVLASELNHVQKAVQTQLGVVITATEDLKAAGGFDGAVGTYEKYVQYLTPLMGVLSCPIAVIGLRAPTEFRIVHLSEGNRKLGHVEWISLG